MNDDTKPPAFKRIDALKFKANFRRELIDTSERQIEHHKSMIKNYKEQMKELNREIAKEYAKDNWRHATTGETRQQFTDRMVTSGALTIVKLPVCENCQENPCRGLMRCPRNVNPSGRAPFGWHLCK